MSPEGRNAVKRLNLKQLKYDIRSNQIQEPR